MSSAEIASILERHNRGYGGLIAVLEEIQAKYGYLPQEVLQNVAEQTGRSLVDIYGVATFYRAFSLKPRGKHLISCCLGTACHVRGGPGIAEEISRQLGIRAGASTEDMEFTFETVNCLGACALGPVVVVDGRYFPKVRPSAVKEIIAQALEGIGKIQIESDARIFPVEVSCARCNHSLMDQRHVIDGYPPIRVTVAFNNTHGRLLLSSLYGSYTVDSEFDIPLNTVVNMFCPHCHAELIGAANCGECGSPMVPMIVRGGGMVQICTRKGCKGHILDLGGSALS